jgi:4-hydroxy-4-methyl-2-oxoglutarate aldolase
LFAGEEFMKRVPSIVLLICALAALPAFSQVKMTKEQMFFYTSDWKGERFPDGRPKVPDDLLKRAVDVSIEDVWDYFRDKGYRCQFDGGWQALHIDKPFAGRALTAQYMPLRPDMAKAIAAEGKAEGRVSGPIAGRLTNCRTATFTLLTALERSLKVR